MRILPQTKKNKNKVSNQSGNKQRNHHSNKNTNSRHNQKNEKTAPPHASSSSSFSSFSSSQPLNTNVPPETSVLKTRRIIKATTPSTPPPPSASSSSQEILDHSFPEEELVGTTEDSRGVSERSFVGIKAPAVQQEELQEKVQQWRKERIETSAAIRKEHKEKEIKEHRLRNNVTTSSESLIKRGSGGSGSSMVDDHDVVVVATREESNEKDARHPKDELPSILSVLPKFPEHKRKKPSHIDQDNLKKLKTAEELLQEGGDRLNVLVQQKEEEEDGTKKTKKKGEEQKQTTDDDDDDDAAEGDVACDATTESWSCKAKQVLQSSSAPVVGAIVAALAIMVTSRWMRKK